MDRGNVRRAQRAYISAGRIVDRSRSADHGEREHPPRYMEETGIANLCIREVLALPEMRQTVFAAIDEAVKVADAEGIVLDSVEACEVLSKIAGPGGSGDNKTSLCNDLLRKRPTEIDFINGAIVRIGREHRIATPVNETLVAAVKALESHYC